MQLVAIQPASGSREGIKVSKQPVLVFPDGLFEQLQLSSTTPVQLTQHPDGHIELTPMSNNISKLKGLVTTDNSMSIEQMNAVIAQAGADCG